MLEALRNSTKSWIVKAFFAVLALSFVAWGVGDVIRGGMFGSGPAIEVGGSAISAAEVNAEFKREVDRLQPLFGGKLTAEDARKLGLLDRTIDGIVTRTLIDEAGRRLGLTVSDEAVVAEIAADPNFRNELGQFDPDRLRIALSRAGLGEKEYLRIERNNMIRTQMAEALSDGVTAPTALVDPLVRFREERRVAETVTVRDDAIAPPAAPDQAVLEQFHKDNAQRFMAPELRALTVLRLRPSDVAAEVEVTDEMVAEAYQSRMDEFHTPESRTVSQVVLTSDEEAAKAADMVKAGKDLAAIADAFDQEVLDLGAVQPADLPDDLAQSVFQQPKGAVGAPVKTALGWHVVKVAQVIPERTRPLAEVKDELAKDLRREKELDRLGDLSTQVEDTLGSGATLEEAAKKHNLALVTIPAIDAQGLGTDGKPVAAAPKADSFLDLAFHTDQGTESQLTDADGDGFFLVRVDQVTPPQPKAFATIRAEVLAAWQAEKRHELAGQRAENIADHVKKGDSLARAAQAFGLKSVTTEPFGREGAEAARLPPAVVADMFQSDPGGVSVGGTAAGWVVARLDKVVPFDPAANPDAVEAARARVSATVAGDLVDQYINALNADFGVKVDRSQLIREE